MDALPTLYFSLGSAFTAVILGSIRIEELSQLIARKLNIYLIFGGFLFKLTYKRSCNF